MDHSFKDRVDKAFGSISSSSSSTPWSLTDAQIERRTWNRDKGDNRDDDQTPVSSSFHTLFHCQRNRRKNLDGDDDDDDDDEEEQTGGDDALHTENDGDEWDIRSSIGLDCTLDNEEEEDAYDKMAEGRENAGDRVYMKDVTDHGPYLNSHNVLPISLHDAKKDPRANHDAAKTRLKEDDTLGENPTTDELMLNGEEAFVTAPASEDGMRIKSILKRKSDAEVKPGKRVRFDSACKNNDESTNGSHLQQGFGPAKASESGLSVPDYILNPSKYTKYSLNDEGSNSDVKNSENVGLGQKLCGAADMPRSVVFIPRKKRADAEGQAKQSSSAKAGSAISIADEEGEVSEMQEDVDGLYNKEKPGRRYRTKMAEDDNNC